MATLTPSTTAPEPLQPPAAGSADRVPVGERWLLGGVAAELAIRLGARSGFIRTLIVVAAFLQFVPILIAYGALTLIIPRSGRRRPGWANLVGLLRVASLLAVVGLLSGGIDVDGGVFSEAPPVWIPVGGTLLLAVLLLLNNRRAPTGADDAGDRRIVLSTLPAIALAASVVLIVKLLPGVRADRILDAGLIVGGVAVALGEAHLNLRAAAASLAPLALVAILLAASGAPLQGGIVDLAVVPGADAATPSYHVAIGDLVLDLTHLRRPPPAPIIGSVGFGRLVIEPPADGVATVHVLVGAGSVYALGGTLPINNRFIVERTYRVTPSEVYPGIDRRPAFDVIVDATVAHGCVAIVQPQEGVSC